MCVCIYTYLWMVGWMLWHRQFSTHSSGSGGPFMGLKMIPCTCEIYSRTRSLARFAHYLSGISVRNLYGWKLVLDGRNHFEFSTLSFNMYITFSDYQTVLKHTFMLHIHAYTLFACTSLSLGLYLYIVKSLNRREYILRFSNTHIHRASIYLSIYAV